MDALSHHTVSLYTGISPANDVGVSKVAKPAKPRTDATPRSDNAVQSDSGFNYISRDKLTSLPEWVAHADTVFMQVGDEDRKSVV